MKNIFKTIPSAIFGNSKDKITVLKRLGISGIEFAKSIPIVCVTGDMEVTNLIEIRNSIEKEFRPTWNTIFFSAYLRLGHDCDYLRRIYLKYPRERIVVTENFTCIVAMERDGDTFFPTLKNLDGLDLLDLQREVKEIYQEMEIGDEHLEFSIKLLLKLPAFVRNTLVKLSAYSSETVRSDVGNGCFSSVGKFDTIENAVLINNIATPTDLVLQKVDEERGKVNVSFTSDHRILNGMEVYEILGLLQEILDGEILEDMNLILEKCSK